MRFKNYLFIALIGILLLGPAKRSNAILGVGDISHDPVLMANDLVHFAKETLQWTKQLEHWLTELERWGDPRTVAAELGFGDYLEMYDFFEGVEIVTMQDAFDLAQEWAGELELSYDFHELYPEISESMPIVGEEFERKFGRYKVENFAEGLAKHYEEVMEETGERRIELEGELKRSQTQLGDAKTEAEVARLSPVIASLQDEIKKTYLAGREAKDALDYTLAMKGLEDGKQRKAQREAFANAYRKEIEGLKEAAEQTPGEIGTQ